jgi:hypothetical protein
VRVRAPIADKHTAFFGWAFWIAVFDRPDYAKSLGTAGERVEFRRRQNEDAVGALEM